MHEDSRTSLEQPVMLLHQGKVMLVSKLYEEGWSA